MVCVGNYTTELSFIYRLAICLLVWLFVMLFAYVTYTYYEHPMMLIRERFSK